jgi:hypothetical protein
MIDLIFLVSLRERVRQRRAEDRESAANAVRFVPVIETVEAPPITPVPPIEVERECVRHRDMNGIPTFGGSSGETLARHRRRPLPVTAL